ncbi:MAG: Stk1 family PASTA domain-containing Ser/Thr kinase [Clostridiales bacterium]|nr:Stk1 family PASTA domain-containing Ser/Thr kinase [Clostridiales bacterium]
MTNTILNNRYKILNELGSGGMSIVYKAQDLETSQYVAVKILRSELVQDEQVIKKFNQEAEAVKGLSHPNIVQTLDVGIDGDVHYIVRELVEGVTLKAYLDEHKVLDPVVAANIALKVAYGLQQAHSFGIIHRDIKPHNIILGDDDSVKITDFGIAYVISDTTKTTEYGKNLVGTVFYTSPEQVRGMAVDQRTDVYSLGVVLYEMVTGVLPFDGENAVNIAMQHVTKEPESARNLNRAVNASLDNIIRNSMAKKYENRYRNCDEVIRDLQKYLAGENAGIYLLGGSAFAGLDINEKKERSQKKAVKKKKRKENSAKKLNKFLLTFLLVVLMLGGLMFLLYGVYMLVDNIWSNNFIVTTVEIPSVEGLSGEEAKTALSNRQLIYREVSTQYSSTVPAGHVISQSPAAGESVNEDTLIEVIISLGAYEINIPNCVGKDIMTIEHELKSYGYIVIGKYNYVNSLEPENTIVKQSIPFGKFSLDGSYVTIDFDISIGPSDDVVVLKNYVGYTETNLKELAQNIRIKILYEYSEVVGSGKVIRQSIEPGTVLESGDEVTFYVSLGSQKVTDQTLSVYLPEDVEIAEDGTVYVTIQQIKDSRFVTVFSSDVEVVDGYINIEFSNSGQQTYYVYVNNKFVTQKVINFS